MAEGRSGCGEDSLVDWVALLTLDLRESLGQVGRGSSRDRSSAEAANMLLKVIDHFNQ